MDVESCVSNVVTAAGGVFDAEGEATELAGVYEVHNGDDLAGESAEGDGSGSASSPSASRQNSQAADPYGDNPMKRRVFDREQSAILERFYDNGMNSTHRRNKELVDDAAQEVGVSADKVKNWIGAETVRRKRQALAVAGGKPGSAGSTPVGAPPAKRKRSLSGYSLFLAETLKDSPEPSLEHKTDIAARWRNMSDEERVDWHQRARLYESQQRGAAAPASPAVATAPATATATSPTATPPTTVEGRDRIVSYAVSLLQSCLERLDQVGVHSYCLLVDPIQMKTHTLASALGQQFHQQQQTHQQPPSDDTATGSTTESSDSAGASSTEEGSVSNAQASGTIQSGETPMDTAEQASQDQSGPEALSVYTAFSRFVLSTALSQQPTPGAGSATPVTSAEASTAIESAESVADAAALGLVPCALDMAFNPAGTGTAVPSTLPLSLASSLGPSVVSPTGNACRYQTADGYICPYVATSPHFLRAHRLDTGHIAKRGRPRKNLVPGAAGLGNPLMAIPALNLDAVASMASLASAAAAASGTTVTAAIGDVQPGPMEPPTSEITVGSQEVEANPDVSDLSVDHMVMLIRNTFNAKYEAATGVKTIPYEDSHALENIVVYGLPDGVALQRPKLYSPEQLRAVVKELERVVFLPVTKTEQTAEELSVTTTTTAATTAASNDAIINNYVTSVDSLITETVPLNVVIESTTET
ncbi:uncharacterized protein LOC135822546 isoform X2 [Sycon ciliatum]|uniref:uncharacterized protein LOC135822546 isoform X2 n=1 Tax=Sycon ciliatum TaxID=27933 RepID=UPI0020A9C334|eukprot:scpid32170/ scgid32124/ 